MNKTTKLFATVVIFAVALALGFGEAFLIAKALEWFFGFEVTRRTVIGIWFCLWFLNIVTSKNKRTA